MSPGVSRVVFLVPLFLFSLSFHEFAHAWVAVRRGDPTPRDAGRLSLNPFAHADWLGTLVLPIVCLYSGWPFFGWARPVPIDVRQLRRGRFDYAWVAIAGPVANLLLALVATAVLWKLTHGPAPQFHWMKLAALAIQVNLMLAAFNLIPIPPLDGFNVLQAFLPLRLAVFVMRSARVGSALLLLLFFCGGLNYLVGPVEICYRALLHAAGLPT